MVERLDAVAYLVQAAWFKGRPEVPPPVRRPGDAQANGDTPQAAAEPVRRKATPEEVRAFFFGAGTSVAYAGD